MKNKINIKGSMPAAAIVGIVILVVSFIILLLFLNVLNLGEESETQICYNSIIQRSSSFIPTDAVPIQCSTQYICITSDGSCEKLTNPKVEKVKTQSEVYKVLGDKMAECWGMFGSGEKKYITDTSFRKNYCSMCYQVYFDDSLKYIEGFEGGSIDKDVLYYYLSTADYKENQKYADYFFGTNDLDSIRSKVLEDENNTLEVSTFGKIDLGKQYYIVMGITSEVSTFGWVVRGAVAGGVVVVTLSTFGIGTAGFAAVLIGEGVGGTIAGVAGSEVAKGIQPEIGAIVIQGKDSAEDNSFMAPTIQEVDPDRVDLLGCDEIVTKS